MAKLVDVIVLSTRWNHLFVGVPTANMIVLFHQNIVIEWPNALSTH